eukprot:CAMPEP_0185747440 /NCGR_PEP_ID=MMETSP1174-20130828/6058_1 /TAXON_ID=35687 /ORGANISM="Dictyocha speculum, Strain CCMP1381" /LENGTH=174 /DNA_ID=CAMNT_0028422609 /DNA_START=54 /DNA_END=578 /DNA_ORIENTATION=-
MSKNVDAWKSIDDTAVRVFSSYLNILERMIMFHSDEVEARSVIPDSSLRDKLSEAHASELMRLEKILRSLLRDLGDVFEKMEKAADASLQENWSCKNSVSLYVHDEAIWINDVTGMYSRELWRKEELLDVAIKIANSADAWSLESSKVIAAIAAQWHSSTQESFVDCAFSSAPQ